MSKFKVGDKVKAIKASYGWGYVSKGEIGKVVSIGGGFTNCDYMVDFDSQKEWEASESDLEPVERKPSKSQRITALEEKVEQQAKEIAELKLIVEQLRKPSAVEETPSNDTIEFEGKRYKKVDRMAREGDVVVFKESIEDYVTIGKPYLVSEVGNRLCVLDNDQEYLAVYYGILGGTSESVDVYELIKEVKPYTANQLRAEIINKAKLFVRERINGGEQVVPFPKGIGQWFLRNFDFVVNEEKRTVVVLCKGFDGKAVRHRAKAKCMPSDVFNEHIGKAIALGRALGLDVSEFEQAVQPNRLVKGHKIKGNKEEGSVVDVNSVEFRLGSGGVYRYDNYDFKIINDTNAIYE